MTEDCARAEPTGERSLTCEACGEEFTGRWGDRCPVCRRPVGRRRGLPWQERGRKGLSLAGAAARTVWVLHRRPYGAFAELQDRKARGVQWRESTAFGALVALVVWLVLSVLWRFVPAHLFVPGVPASWSYEHYLSEAELGTLGGSAPGLAAGVSAVMLGPGGPAILLIFCVLPVVVIVCVVLKLFKLGRGGLARNQDNAVNTYAVYAYGFGATAAWALVPHWGWAVWLAAGFCVSGIGVAASKRIRARRMLVVFGLIFGLFLGSCYCIL